MRKKSGKMESNLQPLPWQGNALPLSYFRNHLLYTSFTSGISNLYSIDLLFTLSK